MLQLVAAAAGLLPGAAHRRPARPAQLARASRPAMAESLTERLMSTLPTEAQTGGAQLLLLLVLLLLLLLLPACSYACLPPPPPPPVFLLYFLLLLLQAPVVRARTSPCSASTPRGRS